ncbi:MAG: Zinc ABC transporter, ATP-binding protein ZnuC, partial [uncultured Acetobacteraceae bacterium]
DAPRDPRVRPHGLPREAAGGSPPVGPLRAGQPHRRGRAERRRQVHLVARPRRPASSPDRPDRRRGARRAAAAAIGHRPELPAVLPGRRAVRPVGRNGAVPRHGSARAGAGGSGAGRGGPPRLRAPARRRRVHRPVPAGALRAAAVARRARDPARRTLQRGGRPHRRRPAGDGAALARRGPHGGRRAARLEFGAGRVPRNLDARPGLPGLGTYGGGADRRQPPARARHGRELGRRPRGVRAPRRRPSGV